MTKTTTTVDLAAVAAAVHALPGPQTAPSYNVPDQAMLPPVLWPARQALADARRAWERCEAERVAAVAATRDAPAAYRQALAETVAAGGDTLTMPDPRTIAHDNVERARDARRQAELTLANRYAEFQGAVEEHRADLLALLRPVHDHDAAEVQRLREELAAATRRLSASRGAVTWATSCQAGDRMNRRPFTEG